MNEPIEIFYWNENLVTGIPEIDEQHKKLVQLLNFLASSSLYKSDLQGIKNIISELTEYATYHFSTEERIWHQFFSGDELESTHKDSHDTFVAEIQRLGGDEFVVLLLGLNQGDESVVTLKRILDAIAHPCFGKDFWPNDRCRGNRK